MLHASGGAAPAAVTAPDAKPSAGATSVNGRANSNQSAPFARHATSLAMTIAAAAATPVLMKFNKSLFRIPGPSSVAPRRLSANDPIVAPATIGRSAAVGTNPTRSLSPAKRHAPATPAAVPSIDIAAWRPRRHLAEGRHKVGSPPPCLTDLAGDCVAAAGGERGDERQQRWVALVGEDRQQRRDSGETRYWRWRFRPHGVRRVPRRCREASYALCPSRELSDAARNVAASNIQPGHPVVTDDSGSDARTRYCARRRHSCGAIAEPRRRPR